MNPESTVSPIKRLLLRVVGVCLLACAGIALLAGSFAGFALLLLATALCFYPTRKIVCAGNLHKLTGAQLFLTVSVLLSLGGTLTVLAIVEDVNNKQPVEESATAAPVVVEGSTTGQTDGKAEMAGEDLAASAPVRLFELFMHSTDIKKVAFCSTLAEHLQGEAKSAYFVQYPRTYTREYAPTALKSVTYNGRLLVKGGRIKLGAQGFQQAQTDTYLAIWPLLNSIPGSQNHAKWMWRECEDQVEKLITEGVLSDSDIDAAQEAALRELEMAQLGATR